MTQGSFSAPKALGVALSMLMLAGCETTASGPYLWSDGWREAIVIRTGTRKMLSTNTWMDCRKALAPNVVSHREFAEIEYHDLDAVRSGIALINRNSTVQSGDSVVFNVNDCTKALEVQAKKAAQ